MKEERVDQKTLRTYQARGTPIEVFRAQGPPLRGRIVAFDTTSIFLRQETPDEEILIYIERGMSIRPVRKK